jgi:hypothetical protein
MNFFGCKSITIFCCCLTTFVALLLLVCCVSFIVIVFFCKEGEILFAVLSALGVNHHSEIFDVNRVSAKVITFWFKQRSSELHVDFEKPDGGMQKYDLGYN